MAKIQLIWDSKTDTALSANVLVFNLECSKLNLSCKCKGIERLGKNSWSVI